MKKKLFVCLLALVLLVIAGVFAVQAETPDQAEICPHCQKAMDSITWSSWSAASGAVSGGHYYLAREYYGQSGMITIPEGADVCLDLRGKMYFTQNIHPFDIYGSLTVMDSGENGQFITTGKHGNSGGFAKIKSTGTLNILSGTIRRLDQEAIYVYAGGLVYVEGGELNMSGGALVGGVVKADSSYDAHGGNVYMKGGSFNFTGGKLIGGMALSSTGKKAQGGNLYVGTKATVTINGGVIKDGYSDEDGGNVFVSGTSLTMYSGSITGGHAVRHGGNIAQIDETVQNSVSLLGGTVDGGVAGGVLKDISNGTIARGSGGGGNYYSYSANGALTVSNCTIGGDMKLEAITSITLSGRTEIGLGKSNGIFLAVDTDMDVSGLTDGAEVFVQASGVFTKAIAEDETNAQRIFEYFKGAIRTSVTLESDFTLKGTQGTTGYCPHCYDPENPQEVTWAYRIAAASVGQHCYIDKASNISTTSNTTPSYTTILDLNGYTINREGKRLMLNTEGMSYIVLDSYGGGKLEGTGTGSAYGGFLYMGGKNTEFELYSGTLRLCAPVTAADNIVQLGGLIYGAAQGSQVIVHGGIIAGGKVTAASGKGGNICLPYPDSQFVMDGGIIRNGDAGVLPGGNVHTAGIVNISGGFIIGGTAADGGNIYTSGTTTVSGGTVYGGKATDSEATTDTKEGIGGNIYSAGKTTVSGGLVTAGKARIGGNIYVATDKSLTVSGTGMISSGVAETNGGNVYVYNGTADVTGGTVTAGLAVSGGNFYISADGKTVTVSGGLITAGIATDSGETAKGGNFYVSKGTLAVSGGVISRGIATYGGGNVYLTASTMKLTGGQVLGGRTSTSTKDGGSIYIAASGHLNMSGGELSDGYAGDCGGNIYMSSANSKLTMSGGTITGGYAYKYGGNLCLNNGSMNMTGGTFSKGRSARGGNICLMFYSGSTATIGGDNNPQIIDGTAVAGEGGNILFMDQAHQPTSSYSPHATAPWLSIGKCTVSGGKAASFGQNIYINKYAYLRMLSSFEGETSVYFHDYQLPEGALYGGMMASGITATGDFSGRLILENDAGAPCLLHKDGGLQVAATALVKGGNYTWFTDNATLMAGYDPTADYMIVTDGELALGGGTYTIDLAGHNVNITGSGAVNGMDSANDTYETYGSATFGPGVTLAGTKAQLGEKTYFAVNEGNTYSFHRGGMDITGVSLRPSAAGLYYTARWQCDELLAKKIDSFGVVVSLAGAPGDDFIAEGNSLYTLQEDFVSGTTGNGVLISGILKTERTADENRGFADDLIYAAAYVAVDGQNYTGAAKAHSLQTMLQLLSDEIYDYYPHAQALQSFMDKWDDYGLTGDGWTFDFDVPEAIVMLQEQYANTVAYQGELHDHAATGGTSDGKNTLTEWLDGMKKLDMDFATLVDHKQYLHMELPEWDNKYFIGGTELAVGVSDLAAATQNKAHINIIFYDPMDLKAAIEEYDAYDSKGGFKAQWYAEDYSGTDAEKLAGGWHFEYLFGATAPTKADMAKLVEIVKKHNGAFVHVHPTSGSYIKSTDPLDYWFADYTGLEIYYTIYSDRNNSATEKNYKLWKELLLLGKKVWATAGNDEHAAPANKALSTIYSPKQDAKEFVERVATGNFSAGHVGVQMVVGDQVMGYETDFTGKSLAFRVGDFHSSVYDPTHTYKAVLIADEEVLEQWEISCEEPFYYTCTADASVHYYRVEVYDVTTGEMLALGNPIWNTAVQ
jgi:hypothetical protein